MTRQYLPCKDNPGNVISIVVFKPQGPRRAYAAAQEGRVDRRPDGTIRWFETTLGEDRFHSVDLTGNNTKKNRERALAALLSDLIDMGWVESGSSVEVS